MIKALKAAARRFLDATAGTKERMAIAALTTAATVATAVASSGALPWVASLAATLNLVVHALTASPIGNLPPTNPPPAPPAP